MMERLKAFLRGTGPGGAGAGAAVLLLVITLFTLALLATWYGLQAAGQESAERETGREETAVMGEGQPEDFPLIFGPGPSTESAQAVSVDGRRRTIPGLSDMDVIGYLQYAPGTNFRCPGGFSDKGLIKRICTSSSSDDAAVYEVTLIEENPAAVLWVQATARDASDDAAAEVFGYVASLSLGGKSSLNSEAWVDRNISSGGEYRAEGTNLRLYGTEEEKTLEIVGTTPPTDQKSTETTMRPPETTKSTTNQPRR